MRIEDMTPEMIEQAKKCDTAEERLAFIRDNGIELDDEQLLGISGGVGGDPYAYTGDICPENKDRGGHKWKSTGRTRPGSILGDLWPDYEMKCQYCGKLDWDWFKH